MATCYFAYGADMDIDQINLHQDRHRRPRISFSKSIPAVLKGYRLVCDIASKYRQAGIFNVAQDPEGTVHGVLYELHPGDSISIAAMKEGEDADYSLTLLNVKTRKAEDVQAIVLHAKPNPKRLTPSQDYLDIVVRAAKRHGISPDWVRHLETQWSIEAPFFRP